MERQEEEAKAQRREAARRRTRDLLLERAKQRLLAIAAAASTASASTSSAAVTGSAGGTASSPQAEPVSIFDGCSHRAQANPPAVAGESDDGAGVKGEGAAAAASFLPARDGAGGAGAAAAVAAVAAAAALSAGIPLYAQETWAARHSKVCQLDGVRYAIGTWSIPFVMHFPCRIFVSEESMFTSACGTLAARQDFCCHDLEDTEFLFLGTKHHRSLATHCSSLSSLRMCISLRHPRGGQVERKGSEADVTPEEKERLEKVCQLSRNQWVIFAYPISRHTEVQLKLKAI